MPINPNYPAAAGNPRVDETIEIIEFLHQCQTDWSGLPYYLHPIGVMNNLPEDATDVERITALLHDTIEDVKLHSITGHPVPPERPDARDMEPDDLRRLGFTDEVVENVVMLTRPAATNVIETQGPAFRAGSSSYLDKMRALVASGNRSVVIVKLADNMHNSAPSRRINLPPQQRAISENMCRRRYWPSMRILRAGLGLDPDLQPTRIESGIDRTAAPLLPTP